MRLINIEPCEKHGHGCLMYVTEDGRLVQTLTSALPTIDAVPVVRCENCEHCTWYTETNHLTDTQRVEYWCNQGPGRPRKVKPDGFCSDGEEREDG